MLAARSGWIMPGKRPRGLIPNIVLRRFDPVQVASSIVLVGRWPTPRLQYRRTLTASQNDNRRRGPFQLAGVPEGQAFLFVEKPSFSLYRHVAWRRH